MEWLTNLYPPIKPYFWAIKLGFVVVLTVGLFGLGYYKGSEHQKLIVKTQYVDRVVGQATFIVRQEQPKEQKQLKTNKDNHDKAIAQLEAQPANPGCPWDADTIRVLNLQRGVLP
jgi:hypothetical protein